MSTEPVLVYVTAPGCHFCEEGRAIVQRLSAETGLQTIETTWGDARSSELVDRERPMFPPAVYLDEKLLGYGRLSERRLRRMLRQVAV